MELEDQSMQPMAMDGQRGLTAVRKFLTDELTAGRRFTIDVTWRSRARGGGMVAAGPWKISHGTTFHIDAEDGLPYVMLDEMQVDDDINLVLLSNPDCEYAEFKVIPMAANQPGAKVIKRPRDEETRQADRISDYRELGDAFRGEDKKKKLAEFLKVPLEIWPRYSIFYPHLWAGKDPKLWEDAAAKYATSHFIVLSGATIDANILAHAEMVSWLVAKQATPATDAELVLTKENWFPAFAIAARIFTYLTCHAHGWEQSQTTLKAVNVAFEKGWISYEDHLPPAKAAGNRGGRGLGAQTRGASPGAFTTTRGGYKGNNFNPNYVPTRGRGGQPSHVQAQFIPNSTGRGGSWKNGVWYPH